MSKLDVDFKISYEDNKNGVIWLSQYRSAEGESGQVSHAFTWEDSIEKAKVYRYNRAKQIAIYFLNAMLDYSDKSLDEFEIKVIGPNTDEVVSETDWEVINENNKWLLRLFITTNRV